VWTKVSGHHLDSKAHPKHETTKNFEVRLIMVWRTKTNVADHGIFYIRHVESYFGEE